MESSPSIFPSRINCRNRVQISSGVFADIVSPAPWKQTAASLLLALVVHESLNPCNTKLNQLPAVEKKRLSLTDRTAISLPSRQKIERDLLETIPGQTLMDRVAGVELLKVDPCRSIRSWHQAPVTIDTFFRNARLVLCVMQQRNRIERRSNHQHLPGSLDDLFERRAFSI